MAVVPVLTAPGDVAKELRRAALRRSMRACRARWPERLLR